MKLGFLWAMFFSLSLSAAEKNLYGKAYDQKEQKVLYHEVHRIVSDDRGFVVYLETKYLDSNLKEFGSLRSDFKKSSFVPNSVLNDSRLKRKETLTLVGDKAEIEVSIDGKGAKKKSITVAENSVAGQGFNNFILKNFDDLMAAQDKKVEFIFVQILDYFNFTASRVGKSAYEDIVSFKIAMSSFFMKAFAEPIMLKYDKKTKSLAEFRGLSNLNSDKNEKQNVVIKYSESPPISP